MANTYQLISKTTVGSGGVANVTLSSIPQTFNDLKILVSGRASVASNQVNPTISFNGSSSNFTYLFLTGSGTGAGSSYGTSNPINDVNAANSTANTFTNFEIYIPNYNSSTYKSFSIDSAQENNVTAAYLELWAMLWSSTSAINSITFSSGSTWVQDSTFYLYGIKKS
jgi:hypothetical protein